MLAVPLREHTEEKVKTADRGEESENVRGTALQTPRSKKEWEEVFHVPEQSSPAAHGEDRGAAN